ncbi:hypothetical protein NQH47_19610 [Burkholderia pseudomallei]|uniref:hypothetical protein n=1 Tax=Burkholderia pseudomallei TaxID=28450 RepID=UPI0005E41B30|nr:hypothetical protein [Burkholderia pseudomallei]MCQ8223442.1 hypothetical protein [Burkholderia pseudomallei]OAG59227.1 hypothetical protein BIM11_5195 [Burkholderia pseudomallei]CAJ8711972.1 S-adenosylhomocysteine hydrolase [Burkholderia pseudomallei]CAK1339600.1 S-adenosylhomocysteine hydrolase [Burkholderia pseudomallei]CAK1342519.1 S-adenosylhomocysteine hydrolase [Burkholderia pseudomallei]
MILRDKLRKALGRKKANVFLRADFEKLGSDAQLSRALRNLVDEGAVVKIGFIAENRGALENDCVT